MVTRRCIAIAAVSAITSSGAALAQQTRLANVELSNLRADIAKDIDVDAKRIPAHVQAPVGIAAHVCGMDAEALARQGKESTPSCTAKNRSQALNEQVQRQLVAQK